MRKGMKLFTSILVLPDVNKYYVAVAYYF